MVEHSNFVVRIERPFNKEFLWRIKDDIDPYIKVSFDEKYCYAGGNLTAWVQQLTDTFGGPVFHPFIKVYRDLFNITRIHLSEDWEVCPHDEIPQELHRYSAKFICDRGVSHELVRHRPCSFAQESTRYVNYGGKDMEFIEPAGIEEWDCVLAGAFISHCDESEALYNGYIRDGLKPQQARAVLPNALKTEIVVTADAAEWAHIRKLRTHSSAHPDMVRVMNMMPWDFLENK